MDTRSKIISLEQAGQLAAPLRAEGRRLIVAAGCFDVLQAAHARFLGSLRADGASLLVVVYDDPSLCRLLGQTQPLLAEQARAQMVAALGAVDYVLIWGQPDLDPLLELLQPDQVERNTPGERNIIGEVIERHR